VFLMTSFVTWKCTYSSCYSRNFKGSSIVYPSSFAVCRGGFSSFWRKHRRSRKFFKLHIEAHFQKTPESLDGGTAILWFRNNLRLSDNKCLDLVNTADAYVTSCFLSSQLLISNRVLPIYVFDKRSLVRNRFRQQRCGPFRYAFVKESVEQLQNNLRGLFSDLLVEVGFAATVIRELCVRYNVNHIVAPKLLSPEEQEYEQGK